MKLWGMSVLVAACMILGMTNSYGQISPFRGSYSTSGLSKADVDLLFATTKDLNDAAGLKVGDTRAWRNSDDGAAGTVRVTRIFQSGGLVCHTLRHDFAKTTKRPARVYTGDWCKTASGEWKIKD